MTVQPNGTEHHFGVDDLFFSTTDRKGVIEQANSTFVRLSHYSHEQLVGAPHNIIRHPDMPAGAFKLVWDELEAGRPACAYVVNLAQDGGRYWVFATLLPLGDGYLSVRMRPLAEDLWGHARNLYTFARSAETRAREEGAGARDAAAVGADSLATGLSALGIGSFEAFTRASLPAEMAAHELHSLGLPDREDATGAHSDILDAMHDLDGETADLVGRLEDYAQLAGELRATAATAGPTIERLKALLDSAQGGAGRVRDKAPDLVSLAEDMGERARTASAVLAELSPRLTAVEDLVSRLRLRIALLRLHNLMVGTFAAELIDAAGGRGDENLGTAGDTRTSMRLLCQALTEGVERVTGDVEAIRLEIGVVPDQIRTAVREVDRFRRPLYKWQATVEEAGVQEELGDVTASIESQTEQGFSEIEQLSGLAARLRLLDVPFDADEVQELVRAIDGALDRA